MEKPPVEAYPAATTYPDQAAYPPAAQGKKMVQYDGGQNLIPMISHSSVPSTLCPAATSGPTHAATAACRQPGGCITCVYSDPKCCNQST